MNGLKQAVVLRSRSTSDRLDLAEFRRMILAWVLLVEGIAVIAWQIFENNQLILLLGLGLHGLAFWLLSKNLRLAWAAWVATASAISLVIVAAYSEPQAAILLCLLPLFTVLVYGYLEGLLSLGLAGGLALLLPGWYPQINGLGEMPGLVIGGGLALLIFGSIVHYWMVDTLRVYYENYLRATREVEEAREQRLELKQVQDDLIHANRELARTTRQLKLVTQAAEEARRAKETFVATVSHELRTPLNMIIGFSEVIAQSPQVYGGKLHPTLLADIASIQRNSQHLLELVNDVLDLSQVDMGNLSISRSRCSVKTIIKEAFDVIHPLFNSKGLYLTSEIQPGVGDVDCDQTRIREVIINLLSNAGRFTEKGGVHVQVSSAGGDLIVAVRDTGPGISEKDQTKLFEPFQQLDESIHRKHGGSGLGLAISKRFVEMHGGRMWLESHVGKGTSFFFSLPQVGSDKLGEADQAGQASRWVNPFTVVDARTRPFKAPAANLVPRCVVLEKGQAVKHLFERYLSEVEVVGVENISAALDCLSDSPAQLLAVNHPDAPAIQAELGASERLPFDLPVVSFWLPGSADMGDKLQAQRYLIKPVSKQALLNVIESTGGQVKSILLVDDNPEILQLFGRILASSDKDYQVLRASDGQQALDMLRRRRPDLMILDLVMPGVSGYAVLEEKMQDPRIAAIPTIIVSAQDPAGVQKISGQVTLSRQGGFSPRDLLDLIQAVGMLNKLDPK